MEIQVIKISEQDRVLVSGFMGEEYPSEIDFNRLMPVVEKIELLGFQFNMDRHYEETRCFFCRGENEWFREAGNGARRTPSRNQNRKPKIE